jgi:hypothetical protein
MIDHSRALGAGAATAGLKPLDRIATCSSTLLLCLLAAVAAEAGITGICPDGSIYIVPRAELIPCRDSKQVEPDEVPPLKPEMLPRPYGWEVFHRRNDPNNPYNLIDSARAVRGEPPATRPDQVGTAPAPETPPQSGSGPDRVHAGQQPPSVDPLPAVSARPPVGERSTFPVLDLAPEEVRDLALIVEYSQQRAPATLARGGSAEPHGLVLRLARSRSFEARLHDAALRAGQAVRGPVVLFTAAGRDGEAFYGNLTFVQGHMAFHPDTGRADELGLIEGRLGRLAANETVLGYVVLPEHMDLSQPMDIYWDDHQVTATLRP